MEKSIFFKQIEQLSDEYQIESSIAYIKEYFYERNENVSKLGSIFADFFNGVNIEFFMKLSEASNFYFYSILTVDKIVDDPTMLNREALLLAFILREKSLRLMYQVFDPKNDYWDYFDKYYKEYVISISTEIKQGLPDDKDISIKEFERVYLGKAALLKASIIAMAIKSNHYDIIEKLEQSIDNFQIALALYDDVFDWKQDWKNNQFNYLLNRVIRKYNLKKASDIGIKELAKYIFFSGEAAEILEIGSSYFDKAIKIVREMGVHKWEGLIIQEKNKNQNLKDDIEILVRKELIRVGVKIQKGNEINLPALKVKYKDLNSDLSQHINYSIHRILAHWKRGFFDARVYNYFPESGKFKFKKRIYTGDVFQRAVILDILGDIKENVNGNLLRFLEHETTYLINKKRDDSWWNFYDDLEFQPSDADTTAQVILALLKNNTKADFFRDCENSIDTFLSWHLHKNGSMGTWFLPPKEKCNKLQLSQRDFYLNYINLNIYSATDIEVMANFLFALKKLNYAKYKTKIQEGIKYIEVKQLKYGCWNTSWYWGELYGVYVCLRLLISEKPHSLSASNALNYIISNQNSNGGWGWDVNISDPLNTAFALISLKLFNSDIRKEYEKQIQKGFDYLFKSIYEKSELKKSNYINFQKEKHSVFKSDSITLAYALRAMLN